MKVKRYEAATLEEVISKIKLDLGPEATIFHIKEIRQYQSFRLFLTRKIEVIAGVEDENGFSANAAKLQMIQHELREVKEFMKDVLQQNTDSSKIRNLPLPLRQMQDRLIELEIDIEIVGQLISNLKERLTSKELNHPQALEEMLIRQIAQMIEVSGPITAKDNKIIAFVGPTGVGKTTTIAKLAANFTLLEKKSVALITIDTYRIAAVEQLKTYAGIMGVPVEVVFSPNELIPVLRNHKDKDLILIDTAGRSHLNDLQMEELKKFVGQDGNIEVQLLISLTTKPKEIKEIFRRFEIARIHRIIFTKLDEVTNFGSLLSALVWARRPASYITIGQNVPEDIEVADSLKLARTIVSGSNLFINRIK